MGWNDHIDFDLHERVTGAEDCGFFAEEPLALVMARRVADGLSMSTKQSWLFETVAVPILKKPQSEQEELEIARTAYPDFDQPHGG